MVWRSAVWCCLVSLFVGSVDGMSLFAEERYCEMFSGLVLTGSDDVL